MIAICLSHCSCLIQYYSLPSMMLRWIWNISENLWCWRFRKVHFGVGYIIFTSYLCYWEPFLSISDLIKLLPCWNCWLEAARFETSCWEKKLMHLHLSFYVYLEFWINNILSILILYKHLTYIVYLLIKWFLKCKTSRKLNFVLFYSSVWTWISSNSCTFLAALHAVSQSIILKEGRRERNWSRTSHFETKH